ncbi:anti-phage ZorAB system protein ZorA [Nesterenkonia suensis]
MHFHFAFSLGAWLPWPPEDPPDFVVLGFLVVVGAMLLGALSAITRRTSVCRRRVKALHVIVDQLDMAALRASRSSALAASESSDVPADVRHLWQEFDETFVEDRSGSQLLNTVDARDVFNSESLAKELVHSRGLAFMPSAMTALGVLGTFLGLAIGLYGLQLGGSTEGDIVELQTGVQQLISGVSAAFLTSIAGVAASLITAVIRFACAASCDEKVAGLQTRIDGLFNRHTPESSLVKIEHATEDSALSLNELHEKIGMKLQEAIQGMAGDMQTAVTTALESAIAPVLQDISSRSSEQTHGALESLMREFEGSFRELGSAQAEQLSDATKDLSTSAEAINSALSSTLASIQQQGAQTQETVQSAVQQSVAVMEERSQKFEDQLLALLEAMRTERQHSVELAERLAGVVGTAGESMKESSTTLRSSTQDLRTVGDQWARSAESMDEHRVQFSDDFTRISEAQSSSIQQLDIHEQRLREVAAGVLEAAETQKAATAEAAQTYASLHEQQDAFLTRVKENVEDLQVQMRKWLDEYGSTVKSQTDDRMNTWNVHSREYAKNMQAIAEGLQGTLEEISDLKGRMKNADLAPQKLQ